MSSNLNLLEQSLDPETVFRSFVDPEMAEKRLPLDVFDIVDMGEFGATFLRGKITLHTKRCLLHSRALYDSVTLLRIHFGRETAEKIAP